MSSALTNGPSKPAWRASVDLPAPSGPAMSVNRGMTNQIIARVAALIAGRAITHLQVDNVPVRSVHQVMGYALRWKSGAHARRQPYLFRFSDQGRFAFHHVDEFVLLAVPVQQRRLPAGGETGQVHPKVLEAEEVAQRTFLPFRHAAEKGLRIG